MNELHRAVGSGSLQRVLALLSTKSIDIDQRTLEEGFTPLMIAAFCGHFRIVRILLDEGANVSIKGENGLTALHRSAQEGHLAVTKLLVQACPDLEAMNSPDGIYRATPLHLAAESGHVGVMGELIEAGANPNCRATSGATPLYLAAFRGHVDAVKVLLRAKANPLLPTIDPSSGHKYLPLDAAAEEGRSDVVGELIQQVGIEGCVGSSAGRDALRLAARSQHVGIMATLMRAGVVDVGSEALIFAAACGRAVSTKFLLQQQPRDTRGEGAYVNARSMWGDMDGLTPLVCGITAASPTVVRLLIDAGADTAAPVITPLDMTTACLDSKTAPGGDPATEEQLHSLKRIHRLLQRVDAVHAVSWLWASNVSPITPAAAEGDIVTSTPVTLVSSILRRRSQRPRVLLAALFR